MPLDDPISQIPISPKTKSEIIAAFGWSKASAESLESYMNYYTRQCLLATQSDKRYYADMTHANICRIAAHLMIGGSIQNIYVLTLAYSQMSHIDEAVFLVCRLLTMVDVSYGYMSSRDSYERENSLGRFLPKVFKPSMRLVGEKELITPTLTARSINESAGIKISWTDNLADHMKLENGGKVLHIFHHVSFLRLQEECILWPDGFIDETLDTIALLFPPLDQSTHLWFEQQCLDFKDAVLDRKLLDCVAVRPEKMNLKHFKYWRDRLEVLQDAYEVSDPALAAQRVLRDQKKEEHWVNPRVVMVVVGLILFFGLVQSIEGALQVYKAYHPTVHF